MRVRAMMEDDASDLYNRLSCRGMEIIVLEAIYEVSLERYRIGHSSLLWNFHGRGRSRPLPLRFRQRVISCAWIPAGPCCRSCGLC